MLEGIIDDIINVDDDSMDEKISCEKRKLNRLAFIRLIDGARAAFSLSFVPI